MGVLCILSCAAALICMTLLLLFCHDIKSLCRQLRYKQQSGSRFDISTQSSLPVMKQLVQSIQELYDENKRIEETALHKEKEMQTLMSAISHDIRTPLTSIQGYLKLIEETKEEAERQSYLEVIHFRLESLRSILEDLFTHSKINDEEYRIQKETITLYPLLCKLLASFYQEFEEKQLEPRLCFSDEQLQISADKELLVRMLQNLISNVLKHGVSCFEIREEKGVLLFINGIEKTEGLQPERLFDRFYKADDARRSSSSGLGLSIVKQIAELHHWRIEASLKENKLQIVLQLHP